MADAIIIGAGYAGMSAAALMATQAGGLSSWKNET